MNSPDDLTIVRGPRLAPGHARARKLWWRRDLPSVLCSLASGLAGLATGCFPAAWAAVSSLLPGFTAEFGMGSGGAPALGPPGRPSQRAEDRTQKLRGHGRPL